ncbi:MAG TPA: beta-ketoacyl synthase N-terminal-like domain-containing protein, partial [Thermoanaerobaculia bacterium]|nr:beta-ketoacyl synthase N-terminal-like domain-containing protein [Thermoanaerobaculia bacterium]
MSPAPRAISGLEVAIIGMDGRFPGARDLDGFWRNLRDGREAVHFFSPRELAEAGVDPALIADPAFVPAAPLLEDIDSFDAAFFGYTPREAEQMDPQHRIFLECCWAALENAGYDPQRAGGPVGVYAGTGSSEYLLLHVLPDPASRTALNYLQTTLGNDKDYLSTRVSYRLGLEGPSLTVQTACSTSLVAVHLACQALRDGECDLALAGGVAISLATSRGYLFYRDGILSPDGHCRAFDERAAGTVFGSGVGAVVLKRLDDAVADGDPIRAVVLGSAVNNDGGAKVGFTAPLAAGQAKVLRAALAQAAVEPATIAYVECHGTGTALGDPIEVEALKRGYAAPGRREATCALGSLKSAVGHLNTAAGVAGLIKTVLALEHGQIPPTLHVERPSRELGLDGSPFYVNTRLAPWPAGDAPRRAGVSSFGLGGTNAHLVIEEAPAAAPRPAGRPWHLLTLSARTPAALAAATARLATRLAADAELDLADAAFTLQAGRRRFGQRQILVARDRGDAAGALARSDKQRLLGRAEERTGREVVFLFPGQGAQHVAMGAGLYRTEPTFRQHLDHCAELLVQPLGCDLRRLLYPPDEASRPAAASALAETRFAQPALFAVEYALARLWMEWGVRPVAMLGHSVGELTAAALAGVFSLADALALVAARGRLMQEQPPGAMLAVPSAAADLLTRLPRELSIAAVNGPAQTVISGPAAAVDDFAAALAGEGVAVRRLPGAHGFHSALMDAAVAPFAAAVAGCARAAPGLPFLSNPSGRWITAEEAVDAAYWGRQLRQTVRFSAGAAELFRHPARILLEVGPGRTLTSLVRRHTGRPEDQLALASLPHPREAVEDELRLAETLGRLWLAGADPDWGGLHRHAPRRRVRLPSYPFERQRFWIGPPPGLGALTAGQAEPEPAAAAGMPAAVARPHPAGHRRPDLEIAFRPPAGELEEAVAAVWQELFGIDAIGADDDFLELGGHSLLAAQVAARLARALGVELPVSALFAAPTVARLARHLDETRDRPVQVLPALVPDPEHRHDPFPLTEVQEAYWVGRSGTFALGNVATHVYTELEGHDLDLERFAAACRGLIARHDMLRAVILPDGRQQVLREVPAWQLTVLDLSGQPAEQVDAELQRVRGELSHQVLPGDRWPLFEIRATRLPAARVRLHLSFDFLLADAWSIHLLSRELAQLYASPAAALPPLALTFRDYVLGEAGLRGSAAHGEALAYWRRRLADLPDGPDLPLARDPRELERPRFHRRAAGLDQAAWGRLKARAAAAGITPTVCLLAAFAEVLGTWSRSPRFLLTLTQFRRLDLHPQVHQVVGDFTSLTLLEVDRRRPETFQERARRLQAQLLADLDQLLVSGVRVLREHAQASGGKHLRVPVVFTSTLGLTAAGGDGDAIDAEAAPGPALAEVFTVSQTPQVWLDHQV